MDLFSNIVNELPLITELKKNRENDVIFAINHMRHARIGYSDNKGGKGKKERFIYPVAYGLTKRGNPAIRAFQTAGSTKRGKPKWKLFLFDNIFSWSTGKKSYADNAEKLKALGFNLNGDLGMTKIFAIAPIANNNVMVSEPDNTGISEPVEKDDITPTAKLQSKKTNKSKKYTTSQNQQDNAIDNIDKNNYLVQTGQNVKLDNKLDATTEPFVKQNKTQRKSKTTPITANTNNNLDKQETEPIKKQDIIGTNDNIEKNNNADASNDNTNIVTKQDVMNKFNDLTNRMNNLYKNDIE